MTKLTMYLDTLGVREMFNMNIKPRLAHIESGAIVEHTESRDRGFVVMNSSGKHQVVMVQEDGRMLLTSQVYDKDTDIGKFFSTYKMVAQSNEYEGRIEQVTTQH